VIIITCVLFVYTVLLELYLQFAVCFSRPTDFKFHVLFNPASAAN